MFNYVQESVFSQNPYNTAIYFRKYQYPGYINLHGKKRGMQRNLFIKESARSLILRVFTNSWISSQHSKIGLFIMLISSRYISPDILFKSIQLRSFPETSSFLRMVALRSTSSRLSMLLERRPRLTRGIEAPNQVVFNPRRLLLSR